jgi:hypothetical protein
MNLSTETTSTIETALRAGGRMHAFLSGGGLRVVRIETRKKLTAYGEHPHVDEALRITAEDHRAGGRDYASVYGKNEEHYLTGATKPNSKLDAWLRQGSTFDAWTKGAAFVFELHGYEQTKTPDDIVTRACAGETVWFTDDRGVVFEAAPSRFPNGEACCSTRIVSTPKGIGGVDVWMWRSCRCGNGATFADAMEAAFAATAVAVSAP